MRLFVASVSIVLVACGGAARPEPVVPAGGIGLGNGPPGAKANEPEHKNGFIPPDEIKRVVRAGFGPMRRCYEAGLGRDPTLTGKVSTKFVIDIEGNVTSAELAPNTKFDTNETDYPPFPDATVSKCVVDAYKALHFPKPEGGEVKVVYPIVFRPGD